MTEQTIPQALMAAIEFEKKGKAFYLKTAAEAKDMLSRKLFETLAADEDLHVARIQEIYQTLSNSGAWPKSVLHHSRNIEHDIQAFFKSHKQELKPETNVVQGYEFAMEMEKTGIKMYTEQLEKSKDEMQKAFFAALIEEEKGHFEAIQNVHFYMTNNEYWNEAEETKHWNWMSL